MECNWEKQPVKYRYFIHLSSIYICIYLCEHVYPRAKLDRCKIITSDCHMSDPTKTITTASIDMKSLP